MTFTLGVVLFALSIAVSIMLHEAGHMVTAKRFGMKVTQYFVGFGPTVWSFRRGETEYGIKAIPAGGFVKIIGMTPLEEKISPVDEPRAFWRGKLWKRTVVLSAGSLTHFLIGLVLLYACAVLVGLPNPAFAAALDHPERQPAVIGEVQACLIAYSASQTSAAPTCQPSDPVAPAKQAGLRSGDRIQALGTTRVSTWGDLIAATSAAKAGRTTLAYSRAGVERTATVDLVAIKHAVGGTVDKPTLKTTPMLGVRLGDPAVPQTVTYGPVAGIAQTVSFAGTLVTGTFAAIGRFPEKVPKLVDAITGHQRDPNGPISVVGASKLGGDVLAHGGPSGLSAFLLLLASLNVFIGIFNLFPLLPLDGGHIAIAWFERVRSRLATRRGRPDPGRVDYTKLLPLTYFVILIFGGISLLTIAADIVNPINLFPK